MGQKISKLTSKDKQTQNQIQWQCNQCTYIQPKSNKKCTLCHNPQPIFNNTGTFDSNLNFEKLQLLIHGYINDIYDYHRNPFIKNKKLIPCSIITLCSTYYIPKYDSVIYDLFSDGSCKVTTTNEQKCILEGIEDSQEKMSMLARYNVFISSNGFPYQSGTHYIGLKCCINKKCKIKQSVSKLAVGFCCCAAHKPSPHYYVGASQLGDSFVFYPPNYYHYSGGSSVKSLKTDFSGYESLGLYEFVITIILNCNLCTLEVLINNKKIHNVSFNVKQKKMYFPFVIFYGTNLTIDVL
eukprot:406223_1